MRVFLIDKKGRKEYSLVITTNKYETSILHNPDDGIYHPHYVLVVPLDIDHTRSTSHHNPRLSRLSSLITHVT